MSRRRRIFGVVVPVPPEIARLADHVRRRYDPNYLRIGSHVTVLPPRALPLTRREMAEAVSRVAVRMTAFSAAFGGVHSFLPAMPVIFARVRRGAADFEGLHRRLARGSLQGPESFPFVPHLTLGQVPPRRRFLRALAAARRCCAVPAFRRPWPVDRLLVVERRSESRWVPLPEVFLGDPSAGGKRPGTRRRASGT